MRLITALLCLLGTAHADPPLAALDALEPGASARVQAEIDALRETPPRAAPTALPAVPRPESGSHLEDYARTVQAVRKALGKGADIACGFAPCLMRADLDGDGQMERIIQVIERKAYRVGFAVLTDRGVVLVGAGTDAGPLGDDLFDVIGWSSDDDGGLRLTTEHDDTYRLTLADARVMIR